ncbi:MAG: polyprenyl synthetase family protein [Gammaproteobacteria bacterium]|nr:polyprenyl synthetase family protein [Gammaproteobacteria bacterium]
MNFKSYLEERQQRINSFLESHLPSPQLEPQHLHQAMQYSVLNGGKRIRPLLVYATGEALGADLDLLDYAACSVELIHAYSLVHDDLPAMDNDDLRRGKPTCHKAFDEATAILTGDALQTLAFEIVAAPAGLEADIRLAMVSCLAKASGSRGMAGGQAMDLKATGQALDKAQLQTIHHHKTGALITACIQLAALTAHLKEGWVLDTLLKFSNYIGLCFQIQDDILDSEGSTQILGKRIGTDHANKKATFTTMQGLKQAKESLLFFYEEALNSLTPFGQNMHSLRSLAEFIILRNH